MKMNRENPVLAIIVPCYNEENILHESHKVFYNILNDMKDKKIISNKSYLCYVNDGSKDSSWEIIKSFISKDDGVKGISLARNFGLQGALTAGLYTCEADAYITIDCDLQEDPEVIYQLINEYKNGNDTVYAVRKSRTGDGWFRTLAGNLFYKIMDILGSETIKNQSEVRLISKRIVEVLKETNEKNLYLRGMIPSVGYKSTKVFYDRKARIGGSSKWSFIKLFDTAIDGMTTTTTKLLTYILWSGIFLSAIFVLFFIGFLVISILNKAVHWNLLILSIINMVGAIITLSLGIIGAQIGKIYKEVRNRPVFIIEEITST